jgi:hypothetical protein
MMNLRISFPLEVLSLILSHIVWNSMNEGDKVNRIYKREFKRMLLARKLGWSSLDK